MHPHSSPRRESSSSPRLDRFLLGIGKWGSAGDSSLSVSEDRFQSDRNIVRFRTKFETIFFFFFPHFRKSSLSLGSDLVSRFFFLFFFFLVRLREDFIRSISIEATTRFSPRKDTCLFFFFFAVRCE